MALPACDAQPVAYSHLLDEFDMPRSLAHAVFEGSLDEPAPGDPGVARELTDEEKREVIAAQMRADPRALAAMTWDGPHG